MTTIAKLFAAILAVILLAGFMFLAAIEVVVRGGKALTNDMEDGR